VPEQNETARVEDDAPESLPGGVASNIPRNLKPYFLCFLVKGERWDDLEGADALMPAQLAFLREQIEWRRYKVAGPVTGAAAAGEIVGFSILEAANAEAALALAQQDPGVQAGRLKVQILPVILPSLDTLKVEFPKAR
jgi:uncharacterized protein YciI